MQRRKKEKGLAVLETIPMIFVFVALVGFTIGFYGVTQKMILSSIASRAYGFEQIRHRANVSYLRDVRGGSDNSYNITEHRYFTVREPGLDGAVFIAAKMNIDYRDRSPDVASNPDAHNSTAYGDISRQRRNERHYFKNVWVKVGHGICLTSGCGE